jgi:2-keto-4-pentenoate hydratase
MNSVESRQEQIAKELTAARLTRTPIAPLTETWPDLSVDEAYEVQALGVAAREATGSVRVGWKVGLTSEAMQRQLGVDQPDFGPLLDDMAVADGGTLSPADLISPRVEGEIAFRLARGLSGPAVTEAEVMEASDLVFPALEIIDSRIADWRIGIADTIADHASGALFVAGGPGVAPGEVELGEVHLELRQDGEVVAEGRGDAVLGHPAQAIVWLVKRLAEVGERLAPGDVILAGALHASVPLNAGTTVEAVAEPLGRVSLQVAAG